MPDNANFFESLAQVDKYVLNHPKESIFPIFEGYIHYYLQLFWNPKENKIYDDVSIMPYAPDEEGLMRKFNPIREDITFEIYPNTEIDLQVDAGC
ncbi:MAG: hypothetical protein ACOC44_11770 [Promethearchaeia archaeon]